MVNFLPKPLKSPWMQVVYQIHIASYLLGREMMILLVLDIVCKHMNGCVIFFTVKNLSLYFNTIMHWNSTNKKLWSLYHAGNLISLKVSNWFLWKQQVRHCCEIKKWNPQGPCIWICSYSNLISVKSKKNELKLKLVHISLSAKYTRN